MSKIKDMKKVAASFVSEEVTSKVLKAGEHVCNVIKAYILHSMMNNDGSVKDKTTEYDDVTTQMYVEFGSTTGQGAIANRYQLEGFVHYKKLTNAEKESGKFTCSDDGYAMIEKDDKFYRINSEENTAAAHRILSQAFKALDLPVGSDLDSIQTAIDNKIDVTVVVKDNVYEGKTSQVVNYLKKAVDVEEIAEFN